MNCGELDEAIKINAGFIESTNEIREYMLKKMEEFLEVNPENFILECLQLALDSSNMQFLEAYLTVICGELKHKAVFYSEDHVGAIFSLLAEASQELFSHTTLKSNFKINLSESIGYLASKFLNISPDDNATIDFLFSLTQMEGVSPMYGIIAIQSLIISGKSLYNIDEGRLLEILQIETDFNSILRLFCAVASYLQNETTHTLFQQIMSNITIDNASDVFMILSTFAENSALFFAPHLEQFIELSQGLMNDGNDKVKINGAFMISIMVEKAYSMFLANSEVSLSVVDTFMNVILNVPEEIPLSLELDDNSVYSVALNCFVNSVGDKLLQADNIKIVFLNALIEAIENNVDQLVAYFTVFNLLSQRILVGCSSNEMEEQINEQLTAIYETLPEILANEDIPLRLRFHTIHLIGKFFQHIPHIAGEFTPEVAEILLNAEENDSFGLEIQLAAITAFKNTFTCITSNSELLQEIYAKQMEYISGCNDLNMLKLLIELLANLVLKLSQDYVKEILAETIGLVYGLIEIDEIGVTIRAINLFSSAITRTTQSELLEQASGTIQEIFELVIEIQSSESLTINPKDFIMVEKSFDVLFRYLPDEVKQEHTESMMGTVLASLAEPPQLTAVSIYDAITSSSVYQVPSSDPSVRLMIERERILNYEETAKIALLLIDASPKLCIENYFGSFEEILNQQFGYESFVEGICVSILRVELEFAIKMDSEQFIEFLPTLLEHLRFIFNSETTFIVSEKIIEITSNLTNNLLDRLDKQFSDIEKSIEKLKYHFETDEVKNSVVFAEATLNLSDEQIQLFMENMIDLIMSYLGRIVENYQEEVNQRKQYYEMQDIVETKDIKTKSIVYLVIGPFKNLQKLSKPIFKSLYESKINDFVETNKESSIEEIRTMSYRIQFVYFLSIEDQLFHVRNVEYIDSLLNYKNRELINYTVSYLVDFAYQNIKILTPQYAPVYLELIRDKLNNISLEIDDDDTDNQLQIAYALFIIVYYQTAVTQIEIEDFLEGGGVAYDDERVELSCLAVIIIISNQAKRSEILNSYNAYSILKIIYNGYRKIKVDYPGMYKMLVCYFCHAIISVPEIEDEILDQVGDESVYPRINRYYINAFSQYFMEIYNAMKNKKESMKK